MKFDPTKPVQTRSGIKARIICTDRACPKPIVALIPIGDSEGIYVYNSNGYIGYPDTQDHLDLVNIPQPRPHAEFIKAWADGADIQVYDGCRQWVSVYDNPYWHPNNLFRIKP